LVLIRLSTLVSLYLTVKMGMRPKETTAEKMSGTHKFHLK